MCVGESPNLHPHALMHNPASAVDGGIPRQANTERLCPAATDWHRWAK
jgi:hypothetical protein